MPSQSTFLDKHVCVFLISFKRNLYNTQKPSCSKMILLLFQFLFNSFPHIHLSFLPHFLDFFPFFLFPPFLSTSSCLPFSLFFLTLFLPSILPLSLLPSFSSILPFIFFPYHFTSLRFILPSLLASCLSLSPVSLFRPILYSFPRFCPFLRFSSLFTIFPHMLPFCLSHFFLPLLCLFFHSFLSYYCPSLIPFFPPHLLSHPSLILTFFSSPLSFFPSYLFFLYLSYMARLFFLLEIRCFCPYCRHKISIFIPLLGLISY